MKKHIVIIEDDEFLIDLLAKNFAGEDFTVEKAMNGKEGVDKVRQIKPDLVLTDLLLPAVNGVEFDGFKVLEEIKNDADLSGIPVVILSNLDQKDQIEKGMKLGAADYLIKSQFTSEEIISKVTKLTSKK
ncbi:response regulator [Candidatus Parcubacteria bacterium]|nr:response regulator [Candidatus Parcubacteria bacterium]